MNRRPFAAFAIALTIGASVSACATAFLKVQPKPQLTDYIMSAQHRLQVCASAKPTPAEQNSDPSQPETCRSDDAALETLFRSAEREIRLQRGTTAYLRRYHHEWLDLMRQVVPGEARETTPLDAPVTAERLDALRGLALKLVPDA